MELQQTNRVALAIAEEHNIEVEDAIAKMNQSSIYLLADESIKNSFSIQLAFLTAVNISHRVFLGGVICQIPQNTPNLLKLDSSNFNDLVSKFGGVNSLVDPTKKDIKILFGIECFDEFCVESISSGWRGGVNFFNQKRIVLEETNSKISFGPIVSASLVCYDAFCKVFQINADGIDLNFEISLWNLNSGEDWHKSENEGPEKPYLPRNIWTLGLGHLGQAYLWTLGFMPFENLNQVQVLLQDADIVQPENIGSQVLCFEENIRKPKTRACMNFLEGLNFRTQIIEKPFIKGDCEQEWAENYPFILNGVDNVKTRKSINKASFKLFIDGATNGQFDLFDSFTMRNISFIQKDPDSIWPQENEDEVIFLKNLYHKYEKEHTCGKLANIGISTPFVGLFSSTIIVGELIRSLNQGRRYSIVSLQMRNLNSMEAIESGVYGKELMRFAV
ncbi:MAG: ThiF family adenylyltransferase [Prolixibacteraceae bacterium]|nr:ThiF family adenylyltransferase [Prolixibacteraceae bacterium]